MRKLLWLIVVGLLSFPLGCASTKVTSFRAPNAGAPASGPTGSRVVVCVFEHHDLSTQKMGEEALKRELAKFSIRAIPSLTVFFPGRQYSPEEVATAIGKTGAGLVLFVTAGAADSGVSFGPSTTTTKVEPTYDGGFTAKTTTTPGLAVSWAFASYQAKLFDVATGEVLWYATMASEGVYVEEDSLIRNMAKKTVQQLRKDGVF